MTHLTLCFVFWVIINHGLIFQMPEILLTQPFHNEIKTELNYAIRNEPVARVSLFLFGNNIPSYITQYHLSLNYDFFFLQDFLKKIQSMKMRLFSASFQWRHLHTFYLASLILMRLSSRAWWSLSCGWMSFWALGMLCYPGQNLTRFEQDYVI